MSEPAKAAKPRFKFLSDADLQALPDPEWLIEPVLPKPGMVVLYGKPGSWKTFVALSMALSVAAGQPWLGRKTRQGVVLYVAAEGLYGFKNRVPAYRKKHNLAPGSMFYLGAAPNLLKSSDVDELLSVFKSHGGKFDLIVFDTLARMMVGGDEDDAMAIGVLVANVEQIERQTGATVLIIHHTTKKGDIERGSSSLRGAADAMLSCTRESSIAELRCEKMKDAEHFPNILVGLNKVDLGEGRASLAVVQMLDAETGLSERPLDQNAASALHVLAGFGEAGATHAEWKKAFVDQTKRSEATFNRALSDLRDAHKVQHDGQGRGCRYRPAGGPGQGEIGLSIKSVSDQSRDTTKVGVTSPPSLGGEGDIKVNSIRSPPPPVTLADGHGAQDWLEIPPLFDSASAPPDTEYFAVMPNAEDYAMACEEDGVIFQEEAPIYEDEIALQLDKPSVVWADDDACLASDREQQKMAPNARGVNHGALTSRRIGDDDT
jgi:hypothetical protein